ncbi:DNA-3-methyladenine glycosylase 2 family protein [Acidaminobacter sp. JC074]|uniref:DNA-3-methyladenine glycosylase family protein n=1 Tax=Acidaminobacter sp. JC074 TaxID=2530199 RepID=UPI001F0F769D|nr:DNA glycosylase [Acidaminobacter sp. JC074]MCH4887295.1 DNA-3-methyladenine glycosylase 2 family protein [Acidaminobacter sp. JC074]
MIIKNRNLNLKQIAESGQTFRWYPHSEGYVIVANHEVIYARQLEDGIEIDSEDPYWLDYFDLERDYQDIINHYKGKDVFLDEAMAYGWGVRILKQDPFEIIVSFIISANNNIKRITSAMEKISHYGTYLKTIEGKDYYDFPSPEDLIQVTVDDYRLCGLGYRDKYLHQLIQDITSGNIDPYAIKDLSDKELKETLLRLKGVGEKVANCIVLFGYDRSDGFPIDTWIKKVLDKKYGVTKNETDFIKNYFDYYPGIIQQYLFFYGRFIKI